MSANKGEIRMQELTHSQRTVARRAAESRATIPHLELSTEVDMEAAIDLSGSITALVVRACALALRDVPRANSAYRDGKFELYSRVNVAVVVPSPGAITVPTVFDADQKPLEKLEGEIALLIDRAATGHLSAAEVTGATFTVWNPGDGGGADAASPVIASGQAAALAAGAVRNVGIVRDGAVVPGQAMTITLACDHRILYGPEVVGFLAAIRERLEEGRL